MLVLNFRWSFLPFIRGPVYDRHAIPALHDGHGRRKVLLENLAAENKYRTLVFHGPLASSSKLALQRPVRNVALSPICLPLHCQVVAFGAQPVAPRRKGRVFAEAAAQITQLYRHRGVSALGTVWWVVVVVAVV